MRRFVVTWPAEKDLRQIKVYVAERAGPAIARRVMREFRNALEFLATQPGAGHFREDLTERPVKFWPVYSWLIVYDPATKPVQILRVLHGTQDIENILN